MNSRQHVTLLGHYHLNSIPIVEVPGDLEVTLQQSSVLLSLESFVEVEMSNVVLIYDQPPVAVAVCL